MPVAFTRDEIQLALAQEAFSEHDIIDLTTDAAGASDGTTVIFGELAHGSSGITTTAFHDVYMHLRRFTGLATAGGASTITLRTSMGTLAADVLKNFTIKITKGTSSGDERTISANSNASPSVVTVSSAFTTTPDTTSFYEIYPSGSLASSQIIRTAKALSKDSFAVATGAITTAPGFNGDLGANMLMGIGAEMLFYRERPNLHVNSINRLLRNMRYPAYLPVGLIPDGDQEGAYTIGTSPSFTEWSGVDAPSTAAKSTSNYPFPFGRQYINVVTAATDNEGIQSATVAVDPDENMHIAVLVQKTPAATETATFDVILYDVTNSTDLKTVTVTGQQPALVYFQQTLESTTEEVAVRVLSNSAAATSFRVGPTWLWSGRDRYAVDTSSLERGRDINNAVTLRLGQAMETDVYHIGKLEDTVLDVERDDRANLVHVVIPQSSRPTLLQTDRRYVELSSDTDTTFAERDMIVQGAMYHIERARAAKLMSSNPSLAGFHSSRAREYARTYSRMLESQGITLVDVEDESSDRQMVRFR